MQFVNFDHTIYMYMTFFLLLYYHYEPVYDFIVNFKEPLKFWIIEDYIYIMHKFIAAVLELMYKANQPWPIGQF